MGELVYMFASSAARHAGGQTCLHGMRRLADALHPHGVRITWLVSPESARLAARELTAWQRGFGDDVALALPEPLTGDFNAKAENLRRSKAEVREARPWAELTVLASGHTDSDIVRMAPELGFKGLWGFCWEQIEVDQITDRGSPWGLYFLDPDERLRPAPDRGVVAMEWTARDLLKSFHSGNPCLYSTDPNDVARGGLCAWEDITYWKSLADNYLRNARYNDFVFLLQHQEAHEMERSEHFRCYTEEDVREAAIMVGAFASHLRGKVRHATLGEAVSLYQESYAHTAPSYMLWDDIPTAPYNPDYAWGTPFGPWPKTFLYYDRHAQMVFIEGKPEPISLRNYLRTWQAGSYFEEPAIPRVRLIRDNRLHWSRELELLIQAPNAMPFGIALWGDYSLYQIGDAPDLIEGKILPRELLFLRYDVDAGETRVRVRLQGK